MHSFLQNFTVFSIVLLENENVVIEILQDVGIIPKRTDLRKCPICNSPMNAVNNKKNKIGFRFICTKKHKENCNGSINPADNTFVEGAKIPFKDILVIIILFTLKWKVTEALENINNWRARRNEPSISSQTICDWYGYCREVAEIHASHSYKQLGGPGKSIRVDETFLTRTKYNRGRVTSSHLTTVFGIYCREDKDGLFFITKGKSKRDLWPLISKYCHPCTNIVDSDATVQYRGVEQIFPRAIPETTNHSLGEFVDRLNTSNTINPLENENKHLKNSVRNWRSKDLLRRYMSLHFYRRIKLDKLTTLGSKIQKFMRDIAEVYPGYKNGLKAEGLKMIELDISTVKSEEIEHLIPESKRPRLDPLGYKNGLKAEGLKMIELDISTVKSEEIEHLIPESKRPRLDPLDNDDVVFMDNIDDPDWDSGM